MNSKRPNQGKLQPKHASVKTVHLRSVTSTNDYARELAESGAKHGTLVVADIQTRGRGRTGSKWISPPGGLWMSIILRPSRRAKRLTLIPLIASLAITEVLERYGVRGRIKWPNDVDFNGRKIAGILCESSVTAGKFQWVIVGIGVNVNNPPPTLTTIQSNYQATSIIQVTGEESNLASLANSIRGSVILHYDNLLSNGERVMLDEYNAQQTLRNRKVRISLHDRILEGVARQVDSEGRMGLKGSNGSIRKIRSEDVLLIEIL